MTLAIDARGLRKRFGRTEVLAGLDLAVPTRHRLRPARAERRGQDDDHQHPHDARAGRLRARRWSPGYDVVADAEEVQAAASRSPASPPPSTSVLTGDREPRHDGPALRARRVARRRARAAELLERFELADAAGRRVGTYSGGMRRRLDLALSLIVDAAGAVPRRADDRPRHPQPAGAVERHPLARRRRHDGLPHDAVPRGGRPARRPHRRARRRPDRRRGHGRRTEGPHRRRRRRAARRRRRRSCASCPPTAACTDCGPPWTSSTAPPAAAADGVQVSIRRPSLDDVFLAITAGDAASDRVARDLIESK